MWMQVNGDEEDSLVVQNDAWKGLGVAGNGKPKLFVTRVEDDQIAHRRVVIARVLINLPKTLKNVAL